MFVASIRARRNSGVSAAAAAARMNTKNHTRNGLDIRCWHARGTQNEWFSLPLIEATCSGSGGSRSTVCHYAALQCIRHKIRFQLFDLLDIDDSRAADANEFVRGDLLFDGADRIASTEPEHLTTPAISLPSRCLRFNAGLLTVEYSWLVALEAAEDFFFVTNEHHSLRLEALVLSFQLLSGVAGLTDPSSQKMSVN